MCLRGLTGEKQSSSHDNAGKFYCFDDLRDMHCVHPMTE